MIDLYREWFPFLFGKRWCVMYCIVSQNDVQNVADTNYSEMKRSFKKMSFSSLSRMVFRMVPSEDPILMVFFVCILGILWSPKMMCRHKIHRARYRQEKDEKKKKLFSSFCLCSWYTLDCWTKNTWVVLSTNPKSTFAWLKHHLIIRGGFSSS